jgi:UDP-glucose 4-epimerase
VTVLVTGEMGFIGLHTTRALLDLGHECVLTTHRTVREPSFMVGGSMLLERLDVADRDAMLASPATLVGDLRAGAQALFNVLECSLAWDVPRVTIASTIGVYGGLPDLRGVSESLPLPMTAGGNMIVASKKSSELLSTLVGDRSGVNVANARLAAVWGPLGRKQSRFLAAPAMVHAAVDRAPAGAGAYADDAIDMLYVKDLRPRSRDRRLHRVARGRQRAVS